MLTEKLFLLNEVFASVAMVPIIVNSLPEKREIDKLEYCCHGIGNKTLMGMRLTEKKQIKDYNSWSHVFHNNKISKFL